MGRGHPGTGLGFLPQEQFSRLSHPLPQAVGGMSQAHAVCLSAPGPGPEAGFPSRPGTPSRCLSGPVVWAQLFKSLAMCFNSTSSFFPEVRLAQSSKPPIMRLLFLLTSLYCEAMMGLTMTHLISTPGSNTMGILASVEVYVLTGDTEIL